jgi:hypothetical protein
MTRATKRIASAARESQSATMTRGGPSDETQPL